MRTADLAVNPTGLAGSGARVWSIQVAAAANPSLTGRVYCGFGLLKSTHMATVRPAGLPRGSTG